MAYPEPAQVKRVVRRIDIYFSYVRRLFGASECLYQIPRQMNHLRYNPRSQIFAKSPPSPWCEPWRLKRLELLRDSTAPGENLWTIVTQSGLREQRFGERNRR